MTLNQALDKLLSKYGSDTKEEFPDIAKLKINLFEQKMVFGGNAMVENPEQIIKAIKTGKY